MTAEDAMFKRKLFWDGRAELEQGQATQPFVAAAEMGQQTLVDVFGTIDRNGRQVRVGRLGKIQGYQDIFQKAFGNPVNQTDAVRALAMLERTFVHGEAPIDRHAKGETWVFDKEQERGRVLFFGDGHCSQCHYGASFADGDFHRILGATLDNTGKRDIGRGKITKRQADNFRFATPTLRDVAKRLPWGHGGQYATAEEFVEMLNNPPEGSELQPLGFSVDDRAALVYFLVGRGKTPGAFESYIPPFTSQPALPQ
jgi:cytochrome c peroxidase